MTNTPQTCVITGALGFLGRHIAAEFAAAGYRVVGVDRIEAPAGGSDSALSKYVRLDLPGPGIAGLLAAERIGRTRFSFRYGKRTPNISTSVS